MGELNIAYANPNVSTNQLLNVTGYVQPDVVDINERPVFGYTSQMACAVTSRRATPDARGCGRRRQDLRRQPLRVAVGRHLEQLVTGETLGLNFSGTFDTANVGSGKTVTAIATLLNGTGIASNYQLGTAPSPPRRRSRPPRSPSVAQPVSLHFADVSAGLHGNVVGFIEGESLTNATTGTLAFSANVNADSPPGIYAVAGSGLTATNYVFVQAQGNATALTLLGATPITSPMPAVGLGRDRHPAAQRGGCRCRAAAAAAGRAHAGRAAGPAPETGE